MYFIDDIDNRRCSYYLINILLMPSVASISKTKSWLIDIWYSHVYYQAEL
jgi:hypothetical protein